MELETYKLCKGLKRCLNVALSLQKISNSKILKKKTYKVSISKGSHD